MGSTLGEILPHIESGGHGRDVKAGRELVVPEADSFADCRANGPTGAAVWEAVGAKDGLVNAPAWDPQAVVQPFHRAEVADDQDLPVPAVNAAEGQQVVVSRVGLDPLEAAPVLLILPELGVGSR